MKLNNIGVATAIALTALAAGCSTSLSRNIDDAGRAGQIVFPAPDTAWLREGTMPNLGSLRTVGAGTTKDQLYDALGRPHFAEGMFGVREWDYIFHFQTADAPTTCQYKVVFDKDDRVGSIHWQPSACSAVLNAAPAPMTAIAPAAPPAAMPAPVPPPAAASAAPGKTTFAADTLFDFNKSVLKSNGQRQLDALIGKIRGIDIAFVIVVGHTDSVGSASYNRGLSRRRAETVKAYLVSKGIEHDRVRTQGKGEEQPAADNRTAEGRAKNRRVEIEVVGVRPKG